MNRPVPNPKTPIVVNSEQSLRAIYDTYYNRMCFYARRFIKDLDSVEDLVQDVLLNIWAKSLSFDNKSALSSFLYISVYNACMNFLKKEDMEKRHQAAISDRYPAYETSYEVSRIEDEVLWEVYRAIEQLPEECKKVFKLSYIENLDISQVAEALNISTHTVKSQRARAKMLLKDKLKYLYLFVILYGQHS